MRLSTIVATIIFLFLISLPTASASPERISIGSPTIEQGVEAKIVLKLDSAPNGLSGYEIFISLENGTVADIVRVDFPKWAKLSDVSIEGDSAKLRAVDLEDEVKPGATDIELATVILGNTRQGESLIKIIVSKMDDDNGNPIYPSVEHGRLVVKGVASPLEIPFFSPLIAIVVAIVVAISIAIATRRQPRGGVKTKPEGEKKLRLAGRDYVKLCVDALKERPP